MVIGDENINRELPKPHRRSTPVVHTPRSSMFRMHSGNRLLIKKSTIFSFFLE
jgi:hypothetical protein